MTDEFTSYPSGKRDTLMAQYIGLKGMNMIKEERRNGVRNQNIMGSVSRKYQGNFSGRSWWRGYA
jgi:hypothetical protein